MLRAKPRTLTILPGLRLLPNSEPNLPRVGYHCPESGWEEWWSHWSELGLLHGGPGCRRPATARARERLPALSGRGSPPSVSRLKRAHDPPGGRLHTSNALGPRSPPEFTLHWRRTRQLRQLKRTSDTVLYTLGALVPIPGEASLPPLLLVILAAGCAGPTRNCCARAGPSVLAEFTTENEFIAITAKRPRSSEPPIPNDAGGGAGWQRADEGAHFCHRCGEPASRSSLSIGGLHRQGVPARCPPSKARRPRPGTPDVSPEMPQEKPPDPRAEGQLSCQGLSESRLQNSMISPVAGRGGPSFYAAV